MNKSLTSHYDAIVIGSGFGGAITAELLSRHGVKALLLERGPWRDTLPVRSMGIPHTAPLPQRHAFYTHMLRNVSAVAGRLKLPQFTANPNGMYELFVDNKLAVVAPSGMGGGSHAYTALHHKPRDNAYWQGLSDHISPLQFEQHYQDFIARMGSEYPPDTLEIPNQTAHLYHNHPVLEVNASTWRPRMGLLFGQGPAAESRSWGKLDIARRTSDYRSEGLLGSFSGSKTTLDVAYLFDAMANGLCVADLHEVLTVCANPPGCKARYRVDVYDHRNKCYRTFTADQIFCGAGTLNTLRLLFRSRDQAGVLRGMATLGKQFATNADSIAFWDFQSPDTDFSLGMPCAGPVSFRDEPASAQFIQAGVSGLDEIPLPTALKRRLRGSLFFIAMGEDCNNGVARWQSGRLRINYSSRESTLYRHIFHCFARLQQGSGRPLWFLREWAATVHPLGGAPLHDDPRQGVINGMGELHEYPGLHIVDATALPRSPGMPPSMSIAAWSRHVALQFLQREGVTVTTSPHSQYEVA